MLFSSSRLFVYGKIDQVDFKSTTISTEFGSYIILLANGSPLRQTIWTKQHVNPYGVSLSIE